MQLTEEQQQQLEEKLKNMSPEEIQELQKQQCLFCQIIAGKISTKAVYEDDLCLAVLDINPASKGHLLLIPKEHYNIMLQVPDETIGHLWTICQKLSQVLLKSLKVSGTNIFVANGPAAGQKAQHFLLHLIPRKEGDGILDFQEKFIDQEMQKKVKLTVEGKLLERLGQKKVNIEQEKKTAGPKVLPATEAKKESPKKRDKNDEKKDEKAEETEKGTEKEEKVNLDEIAKLFK